MSLFQNRSGARLLKTVLLWPLRTTATYWHKNWWHKIVCVVTGVALLCLGFMYGVGQWYIWTERNQPFIIGVSFIADYAESLGLNPHQTFLAILDDLHVKNVRLVSYWSDIEANKGTYNFSELDWEFKEADSHGVKVTLAIGLRQPRWPECHVPTWATSEPASVWEPQLDRFIATVVNRYKNNPALQSYQLENEYFLSSFATCMNDSRTRFVQEANLVRKLDPKHILIISRSNNAVGWPVNAPHADEYGISIYRRVWSPVVGRYVEYPYPSWYYAFLAGMEKIWSGKNTIIHELQAEPWPPHGAPLTQTTLAVQNQSMNATRLKQNITFAKATGMKTMYLWGAEYWYYRMVKLHDPSVWDTAKQELSVSSGNH